MAWTTLIIVKVSEVRPVYILYIFPFPPWESSFVEMAEHTLMQVNSDSQLIITLCSHFWSIGNFIHSLSSPMVTSVWVCLICLTTWNRKTSGKVELHAYYIRNIDFWQPFHNYLEFTTNWWISEKQQLLWHNQCMHLHMNHLAVLKLMKASPCKRIRKLKTCSILSQEKVRHRLSKHQMAMKAMVKRLSMLCRVIFLATDAPPLRAC